MVLHKMTSLTETAAFTNYQRKLPAQMYQSTTDAQVWLENPDDIDTVAVKSVS